MSPRLISMTVISAIIYETRRAEYRRLIPCHDSSSAIIITPWTANITILLVFIIIVLIDVLLDYGGIGCRTFHRHAVDLSLAQLHMPLSFTPVSMSSTSRPTYYSGSSNMVVVEKNRWSFSMYGHCGPFYFLFLLLVWKTPHPHFFCLAIPSCGGDGPTLDATDEEWRMGIIHTTRRIHNNDEFTATPAEGDEVKASATTNKITPTTTTTRREVTTSSLLCKSSDEETQRRSDHRRKERYVLSNGGAKYSFLKSDPQATYCNDRN